MSSQALEYHERVLPESLRPTPIHVQVDDRYDRSVRTSSRLVLGTW